MKTNITDNITIREVRISDSQKIYNAIHLHREYLQEWLPFVTFLTAEEEKAFLSSVLRVPRARRDFIYIIEEKQEVCGLIGFHYSDAANLRTEIGYWLLPKIPAPGNHDQMCAPSLPDCRRRTRHEPHPNPLRRRKCSQQCHPAKTRLPPGRN